MSLNDCIGKTLKPWPILVDHYKSFFSKSVIVCEGKTEIGIVRGIDLHFDQTITSKGVHCADGGGDAMFARAKIFSSLGYPTAIFKDSDKAEQHREHRENAIAAGISVFEWDHNRATEDVIFTACPATVIPELLNMAVERKGADSINAHIQAYSNQAVTLENCLERFTDDQRVILAKAANKKSWFKDIEPAENVGRYIIGPNYGSFTEDLTTPVHNLFSWALNL